MRVFVTGGSGFVGRSLIRALVRRGDEVLALARSDASAKTVEGLGARAVRGDLDDERALREGMTGCRSVFHSAAQVDEWGRLADFMRINVDGTARCVSAAKAAGVRRFIHVSSEAVLAGGRPIVRADESWPRPEKPAGSYPLTKGLAEARVLEANGGGLETVIVRPRFIWGAGDTSVLPKMVEAVKSGRFLWISGGRHLHSTCHIDNLVDALLLAEEKGAPGSIYFVTDGEPTEFRGFVERLLATQGVKTPNKSVPRPIAKVFAVASETVWEKLGLSGPPPATRMTVALLGEEVTVDDSKARRELGYRPKKSIDEGLKEMTR
jgi:nucleoside-diphosphate-sugar epimerase